MPPSRRGKRAEFATVDLPDGDPCRLGYARVSTAGQNPDHQVDALTRAGCGRIYVEHASGKLASRPAWDHICDVLRPGDTLTVTRLDRMGRSLAHLVELGGWFAEKRVNLHVTEQGINTTSPEGRLLFHVLASIAEFQRDLIVANTQDGLAAARSRGRVGGRPTVITPEKIARAREHLASRRLDGSRPTMEETARLVGVSRRTLYRALDAS